MDANTSSSDGLLGQEQQFLRLAGILPEPMLLVSAQGTVLAANNAAQSVLGAQASLLVGRPLADFWNGSGTSATDVVRSAARTRSLVPSSVQLTTGAGEQVDCRCEGALFWPRTDSSPATVVLRFSPRDAASAQFRLLNDKVSELGAEVHRRRRSEEALREANDRKLEFLYMLAHELRNPLAPLSNATEILKRESGKSASLERLAHTMERQVRHLARLLDDLLDVSRLSRGTLTLKHAPLQLAGLIENACDLVEGQAKAAGLTFQVVRPIPDVALSGDMTRLLQVLHNLLANAIKFSSPGGTITLSVGASDMHAHISVRDRGVGIDPEHLQRVFDKFFQADRSLDRSRGGLGLGLAVAQGIVQMHGGSIEAHSAGLGAGSEFIVRLPIAAPPQAAADPPPTIRTRSGDSSQPLPDTVLLVDDNRDAAQTLASIMELWGVKVRIAYDAASGLEAVEALRPPVVLLDIGLPGMSGYEMARKIRTVAGMQDARLIAITGYGDTGARERSKDAGIDHHLAKPANLDELRTLICGP